MDFRRLANEWGAEDASLVPRYSETLVAICSAQAHCIADESAVASTEVQQIQLPKNSVHVEIELIQPNTSIMYNNGTNSYGLLPRTRGALISIGSEDKTVAVRRMNQVASTTGTNVADGAADLVSIAPNHVYKRQWAPGAVDMLHVGFRNFEYLFSSAGAAGTIGNVLTGGSPIARYVGAQLVIRVGFNGESA